MSVLQLPDTLVQIARHLRPRHLRLLLQTSKHIKRHVDTEHYWDRVALHLVYREFDAMEMSCENVPIPSFDYITGLYGLRNLKLGYAATMDVIEHRARHLHDMFEFERDASLQTMVSKGVDAIKNDKHGNYQRAACYLQDAPRTMKGISRAMVEGRQHTYGSPSRKLMLEFANEIDDNPSLTYDMKAFFMQNFDDLFYRLQRHNNLGQTMKDLCNLGCHFYS